MSSHEDPGLASWIARNYTNPNRRDIVVDLLIDHDVSAQSRLRAIDILRTQDLSRDQQIEIVAIILPELWSEGLHDEVDHIIRTTPGWAELEGDE